MRYGLNDAGPDRSVDRLSFPAQSSVLDEEVLLQRVVSLYELPHVQSCRFLSRGDADIYLVESGDSRSYLKIYRPPHTLMATEAEARLVTALSENGVPVVRPVPLKDGKFATEIKASEGIRPCLMFEEAPDGKFEDFNRQNYEIFGRAVACLHVAADSIAQEFDLADYYSELQNPPMLRYISDFVSDSEYESISGLHHRMRDRLAKLDRSNPDYGLCHMDLVISNIRLNENNEVVFFDFGNAGYCWRIAEMALVKRVLKRLDLETDELWNSYLAGYSQIRDIPQHLDETLPWFEIWRLMNFLSGNAASLPLRLGIEVIDREFMAKGIDALRKIEDELVE